jgi:HAE1 family hydrophobic/amphiphilic exporter-1
MQWLAALCVKRPVFATVLILSLVVIGGYSFTKLGVDRFPKIDFPTVLITTVQPGAAPEQIETEITDKIEEASTPSAASTSCGRCRRKASRRSSSRFLLDKNTDVAAQEVRDKVNGVLPQLPKTIPAAARRSVRPGRRRRS